jgi:hypothetical protein
MDSLEVIFLIIVLFCWIGVLMVKWIEHRTSISMFRGSNPGLVIGIFLQDFIISTTLAPLGPLSGESTFHYLSLK